MTDDKELNKLVNRKFSYEQKREKPTFGERMADKVADFGGSWTFIFCSLIVFGAWIAFNTYFIAYAFDKKPFILLNLLLSFLAIFQAPFILMSQNRISDIDRKRDEKEYKLSLKSELEIKEVNEKLDMIIFHLKEKS